jgi:hypothetical protein
MSDVNTTGLDVVNGLNTGAVCGNTATTACNSVSAGVDETDVVLHHVRVMESSNSLLNLALKDPFKKQNIGARLVSNLHGAVANGLSFSDVKVASKAGQLTVVLKFPMSEFAKLSSPAKYTHPAP